MRAEPCARELTMLFIGGICVDVRLGIAGDLALIDLVQRLGNDGRKDFAKFSEIRDHLLQIFMKLIHQQDPFFPTQGFELTCPDLGQFRW